MSKDRDYRLFLDDIINSLGKIEKFTKGMTFDQFEKNEMAVDAVVRNFEIVGEAVKNIPKAILEKYPNVEWKEANEFRNVLIHDYFGINLELVWDTVLKNVSVLKDHVSAVLTQEDNSQR